MILSGHNCHIIRLLSTCFAISIKKRGMPSIWEEAMASWRLCGRKEIAGGLMSQILDSGWQGLLRLCLRLDGVRHPRRQADWATGSEARRSGRFQHASWLLLDVGVIFQAGLEALRGQSGWLECAIALNNRGTSARTPTTLKDYRLFHCMPEF